MSEKKWVKIWIFFVATVLIIVGVINYKIDSLGLVTAEGYLDNAAKELANGKIVAGLKNFDERIFRKKIIQNINYKIDWVVIGSSRTMQLRQRMFLDSDIGFQNYSVSGASMEDYMALIQTHYNTFNEYPKNIILGIDPWIFNKNSGQNRYQSLEDEYNQFLSEIEIKKVNNQYTSTKLLKLLSVEYFIENIKFIKNNFNNGLKGYYIVDSINIDSQLREPDGSIQYPYKNRFPNFDEVKKTAIAYTRGNVYSLEKFDKIYNEVLFEKIIKYLKNKNINIYFYLPPYNPYAYDILINNKKYQIVNSIESYLIDVSKKFDIMLLGSYNPHKYGFSNNDFFDGMHSLDTVYIEIFKKFKK